MSLEGQQRANLGHSLKMRATYICIYVYAATEEHTVSHTMHPWKTIRALSSPSLPPPLSLSSSLSLGKTSVLPGCSNNKKYQRHTERTETIKQKPVLNISRTAKQTTYKLKFFRWSEPIKNGYRMGDASKRSKVSKRSKRRGGMDAKGNGIDRIVSS